MGSFGTLFPGISELTNHWVGLCSLPSILRRLGKDKGQRAGHLASVPWISHVLPRCDVIWDAGENPVESPFCMNFGILNPRKGWVIFGGFFFSGEGKVEKHLTIKQAFDIQFLVQGIDILVQIVTYP